ncbi:MAG: DUF222 domain-containing protein [Nocardioidaceae bacterium]
MSSIPLEALASAVAGAVSCDLTAASGRDLDGRLRTLRAAIDALEGAFSATAERFDRTDGPADCGAASVAGWLRAELRMTPAQARQRVRLGGSLDLLPETRLALFAGEISVGHAFEMAAGLRRLGSTVMADAEDVLMTAAREVDPIELRNLIRHLAGAVDPDADDAAAVRALTRRSFDVHPVGDMVSVRGLLDPETGTMLRQVVDAHSAPDDQDDDREPTQRRADAVAEICRSILDHGLPLDEGVRPHLTVIVDWATLTDGRCGGVTLDGFGRIDTALLQQLACDATVSRVVLGPAGQPIELGRSARCATAGQRRAIRVRSAGRCEVPGCDRRHVQIHHVIPWAQGGTTDVSAMIAACHRHHRMIHGALLRVAISAHGRVRAWDRHGTELIDRRRAAHDLVDAAARRLAPYRKPLPAAAGPARAADGLVASTSATATMRDSPHGHAPSPQAHLRM